ncbi:MAG TPA: large conductance mechanosensitive channel protein MscL [Rhizomicrobium sp.]|nr:large conductance mechanosensitive channel protein MscL [Rhizomicrobium sp.]
MWKEFRKFAMHGNVLDLAVGVVVGAAFTAIVNSLVRDVITPPLGWLTGGLDFTNLYVTLKGSHPATLAEAQKLGAITVNYGVFINTILQFLIVAFVLFLIIRQLNRLKTPAPDAPAPPPSEDVLLLREIRDLLKESR